MYRPKLFSKVPSMKAIDTYNSITTDNLHSYDNLSYAPDETGSEYKPPLTPASFSNSYDYAGTISNSSILDNSLYMSHLDNRGIIYTTDNSFDYPTLRSTTSLGDNHSETESRRDDQGSTVRLVSSKTSAVSKIF